MKFPGFSIAVCLLASGSFISANPVSKSSENLQYLQLDLKKSWVGTNELERAAKEWEEVQKLEYHPLKLDIRNRQFFYAVDLNIGTPEQKMTVQLDTGSSDLWVVGSDVRCSSSEPNDDCKEYGTFDTSQSSTWSPNGTDFFLGYFDGTFAFGKWGMDILNINGFRIEGATFGVARQSSTSLAVLGVGLPALEATNMQFPPYTYDNLPQILKRNGIIARNAYSLFTNELDAGSGSILFGGVDHQKYSGKLLTMPIVNVAPDKSPVPISLALILSGIAYSTMGDKIYPLTSRIPAVLDSGTSFTYFPNTIAEQIAEVLGAVWDDEAGAYGGQCPSPSDTLDFDFGGIHISIPLSAFIIKAEFDNCYFSILPFKQDTVLLGDTFLSHAYVVFDVDRQEISMAQASYNSAEDIEPIIDDIPRSEKAPGYAFVWTYGQYRKGAKYQDCEFYKFSH
ncbi:HBL402Wp [Eremothecium sinecaudum]|uniref:HBL402Wp n=1 Tax=Eremothecium sinecaudum TaxID=45286 RepID=A0A109UVW0_9SACH|nr:HBL402Wp [Eremothecium sinecaudum]AMD18500.1 HBL402Wp [Eremothecium sinecaudum]